MAAYYQLEHHPDGSGRGVLFRKTALSHPDGRLRHLATAPAAAPGPAPAKVILARRSTASPPTQVCKTSANAPTCPYDHVTAIICSRSRCSHVRRMMQLQIATAWVDSTFFPSAIKILVPVSCMLTSVVPYTHTHHVRI